MEIWNHHKGYFDARETVMNQSLEEDLSLIDALYGRDTLPYGATPEQVKEETLRQVEIDWRCNRNELAECMVALHGGGS